MLVLPRALVKLEGDLAGIDGLWVLSPQQVFARTSARQNNIKHDAATDLIADLVVEC